MSMSVALRCVALRVALRCVARCVGEGRDEDRRGPPLTVVTLKMAPSHAKFSNQVPPRTSRSLISEFDVLCFMSPNPGPNWGARRDLSGIFRSIEGVHERPRFCQGRISTGRGSALPREGWHHVVKQAPGSAR